MNKNINPTELGNEEESSRETSKIQNQISQLESDGREKCFDTGINKEKKMIKPGEAITYTKPSEGIKTIRNLSDRAIPLSEVMGQPSGSSNNKIQKCIADISKDPLIADLRVQVNKLYQAQVAKHRHRAEAQKKVDEYVNSAIAKYAEANNFQMIVNNNYSSESILYNADKVSLNVTDDVLAFISKTQGSATNEANSKAVRP